MGFKLKVLTCWACTASTWKHQSVQWATRCFLPSAAGGSQGPSWCGGTPQCVCPSVRWYSLVCPRVSTVVRQPPPGRCPWPAVAAGRKMEGLSLSALRNNQAEKGALNLYGSLRKLPCDSYSASGKIIGFDPSQWIRNREYEAKLAEEKIKNIKYHIFQSPLVCLLVLHAGFCSQKWSQLYEAESFCSCKNAFLLPNGS